MLKQSFLARRHPVNVLRRDALLADLLAQFPPTNILERSTCEHLAGTLEQLEVMKPGSPDWQRLVQTAQTLSGSLEESRSARVAGTPPDDYENATDDQIIERLEALLTYAHETRDLRHHVERAVAAEKAQPVLQAEGVTKPTSANDVPTASSAVVPAPEPTCPYGCGTLTRCAEIKETNYAAWEVLHGNDPKEVKKRDEHATKVMIHQVGKPNPWL
jgi:hypothetical protein